MKKNSIYEVKPNNKKMVLDLILSNPGISRLELSEHSKLSPGTITTLVSELITENKVCESSKRASTGGRPKIGLSVVSNVGDIVVFEVKQRLIVAKLYDNNNELVIQENKPMNYLNGNTIVEVISDFLSKMDTKPKHIGVLVEENIEDNEINYLLSTSISQDSIPLETAIKMYIDVDVTVEKSLKYVLNEEILNVQLDKVALYAYININEKLSTTVFHNGERVSFNNDNDYNFNLSDLFMLHDKDNRFNLLNKQYKWFVSLLSDAIKVMLMFYPLDTIFLVGESTLFPRLDKDLMKAINKNNGDDITLKNIKMVVPNKTDRARHMNKILVKNQLIGGK